MDDPLILQDQSFFGIAVAYPLCARIFRPLQICILRILLYYFFQRTPIKACAERLGRVLLVFLWIHGCIKRLFSYCITYPFLKCMKKEYKKYSQPERVFRLRVAAWNDTICLFEAFVSFESLTVSLGRVGRFFIHLNQRLQNYINFLCILYLHHPSDRNTLPMWI